MTLLAVLSALAMAGSYVEVPVEVQLGPAMVWPSGPDLGPMSGLRIGLAAVMDQDWIAAHPRKVPAKYREAASMMREVRLRPGPVILVPSELVVSPWGDGLRGLGATWSLVGMGSRLVDGPVALDLRGSLVLSYQFLYRQNDEYYRYKHFLRPGVALEASVEVPLGERWTLGLSWESRAFLPARHNLSLDGQEALLWHIGSAGITLSHRFGYWTQI